MKNMKRNAARLLLFAVLVSGVISLSMSLPREGNFVVALLCVALLGVITSYQRSGKFHSADVQMDRIAASQEPSPSGSHLAVTRLDGSTSSSVTNVAPIRRGGIDWGDFEHQVREARASLAPRVKYDPFAIGADLTGEVPEFHPTGRKSRVDIGDRYPSLQGLIR